LSTTRYAGGIEGSGDHGDYALSFTRFDTDNDVLNGSFNQETVAANVGWKATPELELRSVFRSDYGRTGVPGPWAILPPDPEEYYRHRNLTGGVAMTYSTTPSWTQRASYSANSSCSSPPIRGLGGFHCRVWRQNGALAVLRPCLPDPERHRDPTRQLRERDRPAREPSPDRRRRV